MSYYILKFHGFNAFGLVLSVPSILCLRTAWWASLNAQVGPQTLASRKRTSRSSHLHSHPLGALFIPLTHLVPLALCEWVKNGSNLE